ncbi:MAG: hypothetical protein ACR2LN_02455 [Candidatus Levyibacteriota bacterium]
MQKKKSLPRKRKRFFKKIFFISLSVLVVVILGSGGLYYVYLQKTSKLQIVIPLAAKPVMRSEQQDIAYTELQKDLQGENIAFSSITKEKDGSFKVTLQQGGVVTFSSQKDIMTQIASLQYILSHLTMEGKLFSQLDLRFEKPVIKLRG